MIRHDDSDLAVGRRDEISLRGDHNLENVLAACAAAHLAGAAPADIAAGVKTFRGVEHRLELVGEIGGVEFYNDSKATNVDAALKAIEAFAGPLIVILGGTDKGSPYTPLQEPLRRRARRVILIGAAAEKIASDLGDGLSIVQAGTLDRAVQAAKEQAQPGDVVLLAPACSSFDQFENYEHRGRVFKQLVEKFASDSSDKCFRAERIRMPRSMQHDRKLFGVTLTLCLIGAIMVFSASALTLREQGGNGYYFLLRQVLWVALGMAGMFLMMNTDYRKLRQPRVIFTALSVTLILLLAVFFLDRSHATHRWVRLGPLSLQPSEIAKLVVIFYLAWFLESRREPRGPGINNLTQTLLPAMGTVLLMVALVYKEPDMGTACMIFFIAAVMLFIAGLSYRYIFGAVIAAPR